MAADNQPGLDDGDVKVVMRRRERNRPQQPPSYDTTFLELDADELNVDEFFRSAHLPKGDFLSIQTGWAEKELPPKIGNCLLCFSRTHAVYLMNTFGDSTTFLKRRKSEKRPRNDRRIPSRP